MSAHGNDQTGRRHPWMAAFLCLAVLMAGCNGEQKKAIPDVEAGVSNSEDPYWVHRNPAAPAKVAVVFVHGLFGTTSGTWTNANGRRFFDLIRSAPDVGNKIDVFAFGFTSSITRDGSLDVRQGANKLEEQLNYHKVWDYDTVVFVGHSMGGLVIMQELINHPEHRAEVPLIVLYATPQEGSQLASVAKLLHGNPALKQLIPGDASEYLKGLDDAWSRIPSQERPKMKCAYETASTYGLPVVSQFSSTRFCDGARVAIGGASHLSIVKPDRQNHDSVIMLANALAGMVGSRRDTGIQMPDFTPEGDQLVYAWSDPESQARAKLVNLGPLPVRYVLGTPSSDKLMISPTNTPREIKPGEVEELKFDLLWRGAWKNEYRFTLGTSTQPTRTVVVRVADPAAQQARAAAVQQGVAADLDTFLQSQEGRQELMALSEEARQDKLVELAGMSLQQRSPSTSPAAQWVLTADTLSSLGWSPLAARALRKAEVASPDIVRSSSVQVLSSDIATQSGNRTIFEKSETPDVEVPQDLKVQASPVDAHNAAVLSTLSTNLQAVPALEQYGLTLKGDVLQKQGEPVQAQMAYRRATELEATPETKAKIRAASRVEH